MEILNILGLILIATLVGFGFNIMQDIGMVFEWYKEWLIRLPHIKNPKWDLMDIDSKEYLYFPILYYLSKPLGLCIVCNTTWIGIICGIVLLDMPIGQKIFSSILIGVASGGLVTIVKLDHKRLLQ